MDKTKLQVFYDGGCVLCSKEIDYYKTQSRAEHIQWLDINDPLFKAEDHGLDPQYIQARFHAKKNGEIFEGVSAFEQIWQELGIFKPLSWSAQNPATRPLLNVGYTLFTKLRPYLPRKSAAECEADRCTPKPFKK